MALSKVCSLISDSVNVGRFIKITPRGTQIPMAYDMNGLETSLPAILILALLTTATGHTLFIYSFRNFSISTASIISGVQPVYGIIIGMIVLGEYPALSTIFGGVMILGTVLIESIRNFKE